MISYKAWLNNAKLKCKEKGVEISAPLFLLEHLLQKDRVYIISHENEMLSQIEKDSLDSLLDRFLKHEPLAYITQKKEFYGRDFSVDQSVLIPRPETELLVDIAKDFSASFTEKNFKVLDIGTGSGCIIISLLCEIFPYMKSINAQAIDISKEALETAKKNALFHNVLDCIDFINSSIEEFSNQSTKTQYTFDCILSNPPYIPLEEYFDLEQNVKEYEPKLALTSGVNGFEIIEQVLEFSGKYLNSGGLLLIEHGYNQNEEIQMLAQKQKIWSSQETIHDLAKIPRVFKAIRK